MNSEISKLRQYLKRHAGLLCKNLLRQLYNNCLSNFWLMSFRINDLTSLMKSVCLVEDLQIRYISPINVP